MIGVGSHMTGRLDVHGLHLAVRQWSVFAHGGKLPPSLGSATEYVDRQRRRHGDQYCREHVRDGVICLVEHQGEVADEYDR